MFKYTAEVKGMMCSMCEAHSNDAIRKAFSVKKVTSNHSKNEVVIITEEEITNEQLKKIYDDLGYDLLSVRKEPAKKGLLGWK